MKNQKEHLLQMADAAERGFLLQDRQFLEKLDSMLLAAINDKAKEPRESAMKLLKKMKKKYRMCCFVLFCFVCLISCFVWQIIHCCMFECF